MMRFMAGLLVGATVALVVGLVPVLSQDDETQQEKWERLRQPGEQHKWLAQDVGDWKIKGKLWVGPDQTIPVEGNATVKMIFDRYAHEEYSLGDYRAFGYVGYDNVNEEFQALYCGTSGTGMQILSGQLNEDRTVLTLTGERAEKALGGAVRKQKVVITRKGADETLVEMSESVGDAAMRNVVALTYTRVKE